jgi:hypothetical protein
MGGDGAYWFLGAMACACLPLACIISTALIRISQD